MDDFRNANTGGRRNEEPLSDDLVKYAIDYAVSLGMPKKSIYYSPYELTSYGEIWDVLRIGTDVLPLNNRTDNPNDNISLRGAIAHEIVGHREARLQGFTQSVEVLEEAQASIRAARFAPDLSCRERLDLLKDGIGRLRGENINIRSVKNRLHINQR